MQYTIGILIEFNLQKWWCPKFHLIFYSLHQTDTVLLDDSCSKIQFHLWINSYFNFWHNLSPSNNFSKLHIIIHQSSLLLKFCQLTLLLWWKLLQWKSLPLFHVALCGFGVNFLLRISSSSIFAPLTLGPGSFGVI